MKKLLIIGIVYLLISCEAGGMATNSEIDNPIQQELDESLKAENPFLGTWRSVDPLLYDLAHVVFNDKNNVKVHMDSNPSSITIDTDYAFTETYLELENNTALRFYYDFSVKNTFTFMYGEFKKVSLDF